MSQIVFGRDTVQLISLDINKSLSKLSTCQAQLSSTARSLESSVAARRNVSSRMHGAGSKLSLLENKCKSLHVFLQQAVTEYGKTEDYLNERAGAVGQLNNTKSILDLLNNRYADHVGEAGALYRLRNAMLLFGANVLDSKNLLIAASDLRFKMFEKNGNTFIKILNGTTPTNYDSYRKLLTTYLGGNEKKWDSNLIKRLVNEGLFLYGDKGSKANPLFDYSSRGRKLLDSSTDFLDLGNSFKQITESQFKTTTRMMKEAVANNTVLADFKGWSGASSLTKLGKGLGIAGSVLTVADNVYSDLYNKETGKLDLNDIEKVKKFGVDLFVDVGVGAGSMAAGAAVGSFFLPPVGTVVGGVAGAAIHFAANSKFIGDDPKQSLVDWTKHAANQAVDWAEQSVNQAVDWTKKSVNEAVDWTKQTANDAVDWVEQSVNQTVDKLTRLFW